MKTKNFFNKIFLIINSYFFVNNLFAQDRAIEVLPIKSPNKPPEEVLVIKNPANLERINPMALKHYTQEQVMAMPNEKVEQINWLYQHSFVFVKRGQEPIDILEINNRDEVKRKKINYKDSEIELLSNQEVQSAFKEISKKN
jgi:hypothetical protein